jgi:capsular exopolysaccharide synthesis family protein
MSQDIQITNAYPTATGGGDYWTQGQAAVGGLLGAGGMGGGMPASRQSALKRMHKVLRGRYPLAIVLALIGAIIGSFGLYTVLPPKWQSAGMVKVDPIQPGPGVGDGIMPLYTVFIASQAALIESSSVAEAALTDPQFLEVWNKYHSSPMLATDFLAAVDTDRQKGGQIITVTFSERNKEVAQSGVRAVIRSYMSLYGDGDRAGRQRKIKLNEDDLATTNSNLAFANSALQQLAEKYGTTDLAVRDQALQTQLAQTQGELTTTEIAYKAALASKPTTGPTDKEHVYLEIAQVDGGMKQVLAERRHYYEVLEDAHKTWGTRHPLYAKAWDRYQLAALDVEDYARDYIQMHPAGIPAALDLGGTGDVAALKKRLVALQDVYKQQSTAAIELGNQRAEIAKKQQEITRYEADLKRIQDRIDSLQVEQKLAKSVSVIDPGSEAINTGDKKRYIGAGAGFLLGGFLPIGLLVLWGMNDARFRFSDETTDSELTGITLLGILPNLPDRLSDPQQAGIAAHCVHQIRTMLQISRSNDEPQVVAVTSAAPGDGKTSLTLALGLSYAACGARTLLIDCDLVAAGLSHRLNVKSPEGVLEAVANRALLEFVRTTDIADVAILPVGTTHAHHASTLSPVALRRLLNESKKHFDIILVDTGPILGSIEASLVCAAADRTILTVARGQQRPLVERAIGHLQAIGARLAGVVFNRAQARDFERSLSGIALRSRSHNGNGSSGSSNGGGSGSTAQAASKLAGSVNRA